MGVLFIGAGMFMLSSGGGITFTSVAFVLGILFMLAGLLECLSYKSYRGDEGDKTWVLVDGITTFILGFLVIFNKLASDATVPLVLGLWIGVSGIRNLIRAWEKIEVKDSYFYGHLATGLLNVVAGLYMYFNADLFMLPVAVLVGICMMVQGLNVLMVGSTISVIKSAFIMTKEEMLIKAAAEAERAHIAAKEAIKMAKEAKANVKVIEATPEEELDAALAVKPGETTEETDETAENAEAEETAAEADDSAEK